MRMTPMWNKTAWGLSFLLGQASVFLGLAVALGWSFGFALIVIQKTGPRPILPVEPPLIGLLLGLCGWLLARSSRQSAGGYAVAGMVVNALPLILASVLIWQRVLPH